MFETFVIDLIGSYLFLLCYFSIQDIIGKRNPYNRTVFISYLSIRNVPQKKGKTKTNSSITQARFSKSNWKSFYLSRTRWIVSLVFVAFFFSSLSFHFRRRRRLVRVMQNIQNKREIKSGPIWPGNPRSLAFRENKQRNIVAISTGISKRCSSRRRVFNDRIIKSASPGIDFISQYIKPRTIDSFTSVLWKNANTQKPVWLKINFARNVYSNKQCCIWHILSVTFT